MPAQIAVGCLAGVPFILVQPVLTVLNEPLVISFIRRAKLRLIYRFATLRPNVRGHGGVSTDFEAVVHCCLSLSKEL
jgi:hypothetical protein